MKTYDLFQPEWAMWHLLRSIREKIVTPIRDYDRLSYEKLVNTEALSYKKAEEGIICRNSILDGNYTYKLTLPAQEAEKVYLLCKTGGGEGEVFVDGKIKGSVDYMHNLIFLGKLTAESRLEIFLTRNYQQYSEGSRKEDVEKEQIIYRQISLCRCHENTKRLFYLGQLLFEAAERYKRPDFYELLKKHLYEVDENADNEAFDKIAKEITAKLLNEGSALPPVENKRNWLTSAHSHLDLMFHWPEKDTIRKIGRTLSNTVSFLKRYPNNLYAQSQMQIFDWCSRYYPELFQEIKTLEKEGKLFSLGGLWCEADTNLPFSECWIRQCLYGKAYEMQEFGHTGRTAYMPDTFGFNPVLPQILKDFGYDYFVTTKLAWNDTKPFGHNEFVWEGIDGTRINGYQFPGFYSGSLDCETAEYAKEHIAEDSAVEEHLFQYGAGDGGGGVNEEMLITKEMLTSLGVMDTFEDVDMDTGLDRIFAGNEAPVVSGELYLQKHRGTYTNHAEIKQGNRDMERRLKNAEEVNALLEMKKQDTIGSLFRELLVCQFHDTMAGTIVDSALSDVKRYYSHITEETEKLLHQGGAPAIFNNSGRTRDVLAAVRTEEIADWKGCPHQEIRRESDGTVWSLILLEKLQPFELRRLSFPVLEIRENTNLFSTENPKEAETDFRHNIEAYFDRGGFFDSWDINGDFEKYPIKGEETVVSGLLEDGPLRRVFVREMIYPWGKLRQYMSLYSFTSRVDFYNEMEVTKMHCIVKAAFESSGEGKEALFDMGYGYVKREVSRSAIKENGTFETAHQKWMLAGSTAVLNDGKYGCDVCENRMRLTLVKTSDFPGKEMDMGHHTMSYSLYESRDVSAVIDEAENLNHPYCVVYTDKAAESPVLGCENIKAGWMKEAEDKNGIILRLYEGCGTPGRARITLGKEIRRVCRTDMQEKTLRELEIVNGQVEFCIKGFEIVTLRLCKNAENNIF